MMKEESSYGTSGLENATRDTSKEQLHVKLCNGSCHAEQILQTLNAYRRSGIFTDVVLLIDGQEFPCHRATLSANSTYFRAMFGGSLKEGHQNIINIQKISASTMSLLLDSTMVWSGPSGLPPYDIHYLIYPKLSCLSSFLLVFCFASLHPFPFLFLSLSETITLLFLPFLIHKELFPQFLAPRTFISPLHLFNACSFVPNDSHTTCHGLIIFNVKKIFNSGIGLPAHCFWCLHLPWEETQSTGNK